MRLGQFCIERERLLQLGFGLIIQFLAERHLAGDEVRGGGIGGDCEHFGEGLDAVGHVVDQQVTAREHVGALIGADGVFEDGDGVGIAAQEIEAFATEQGGFLVGGGIGLFGEHRLLKLLRGACWCSAACARTESRSNCAMNSLLV